MRGWVVVGGGERASSLHFNRSQGRRLRVVLVRGGRGDGDGDDNVDDDVTVPVSSSVL